MPSPFPGMDPYLEAQESTDFHSRFVSALSDELMPGLRPRYTARIERRVYVESIADSKSIVPDVLVVESGTAASDSQSRQLSSLAAIAPIACPLPIRVEHRETYLVIRDREDQRVVTVIELLSPGNKRAGKGRDVYLEKRTEVLASRTNLVELDLLRGGQRLPMAAPLPPGDYYALVCRSGRASADVYAWSLEHPLPVIPVPLDKSVPDVPLELQRAFQLTYDRAAYQDTVRYSVPLSPPLSEDQSRWLKSVIA